MAVARIDFPNHIRPLKSTIVSLEKAHGCAGISGNSSTFVIVDVGLAIAHHFISGPHMHIDCDLICHCSRRTVQSGFMAEHGSASLLQFQRCRIFGENVIPGFGLMHGFEHRCRWPCNGVGAQIDGGFIHGAWCRREFDIVKLTMTSFGRSI